MKVLIADDYESTRSLLRRILVRDYSCGVVEAETGLDVLAAIGSQQFTFIILDVQMPIMDGIETLQAIRRSSEQPDLPVVMLSAERDEAKVRRILSLGITDYLTKPLKAEHISGRLARVVAEVSKRARRASGDALSLTKESLVVLADGDPDFRHFFSNMLAPLCMVTTADGGAQGLKLALQAPPRAIFLGAGLGALDRDLFVAKARELPPLKATALVAIAARTEADALRASGVYEGVVARTFVPEVFTVQIERLFHTNAALRQLLARHPNLRVNLITAIEQVFGMMLSTEVTLLPEPPDSWGRTGAIAAVTIDVPDERLAVEFTVCGSTEAALALGAGLASVPLQAVTPAESLNALQEVANMITGRLQNGLRERGTAATCGLPRTSLGPLPEASINGDDAITVYVESTRDTQFRMSLAGRVVGETAEADAAADSTAA